MFNNYPVCIYTFNNTVSFCNNRNARVSCNNILDTCSDKWRLSFQKRHSLSLHIRTHKSTVSIIIFKKRDHRCCHTYQLLWRNIHVVNFRRINHLKFTHSSGSNYIFLKKALLVKRCICLSNCIFFFFKSCLIFNLSGYLTIYNFAVRSFNKSIIINL